MFVDEPAAAIEQIGSRIGLDVAQLHGGETPAQHPAGLRVWKAFRVKDGSMPDPGYPAEAILLDGPSTGHSFDWRLGADFRGNLIVAGGLDENNVRQAVECARPWGVDASSRIEISPGRKDHARMGKFIRAALES